MVAKCNAGEIGRAGCKLPLRVDGDGNWLAQVFDRDLKKQVERINHAMVSAAWHGKEDNQIMKVAVLDYTGHFYRGRIEGTSDNGHWDILAEDGELVPGVSAASFVAVRLEGS